MSALHPLRIAIAALVLGAAAAPAARAQSVFNVGTDFSAATNPAGNWSYGYTSTLGGAFSLYTVSSTFTTGVPAWRNSNTFPGTYPNVYYNSSGSAVVQSGTLTLPNATFGLHPGDTGSGQVFSVARLTLPSAGTFRLDAVFTGIENFGSGTTVDVHVYVNGTAVLDGNIAGFGQSSSLVNHVFTGTPGMVVDFIVGNGANGNNGDTTSLVGSVIAVPEPALAAAVLAVAAGFVSVARRRVSPR